MHPTTMNRKLAILLILCSNFTRAADWPQFLGPNRNGISAETIQAPWPTDGPPQLWSKTLGQGFSGPVVAQGKLILFHRLGDRELVQCLEAKTGRPIWTLDYPTRYQDDFGFDEGPRATPTISAGRVYTFGAEGMLHCLDFQSGRKIWGVNAKEQFRAGKGFFGMACSPLAVDGLVLVNVGGAAGAGIVAFEAKNGQLRWKATRDEASYSSPVAARIEGQLAALFFTRAGLVGLEPAQGTILFQFPWRSRQNASVNAATPLVVDDQIFLSASYQTGAVLLKASHRQLRKIWSGDDILSNHYATSIYRDGFLYGFNGRQEFGPHLRCVECRTGRVRWTAPSLGAGSLLLAGDSLLVLLEDGRLLRVKALPDRFRQLDQAQILPAGVRAYPALADGLFFARGKDKLVCVRVGAAGG